MSRFPRYDTKLFTEVFESFNDFLYYYKNDIDDSIKVFDDTTPDGLKTLKRIYYLLYARYGNNPIANYDETQFIYKLFTVVFQYGPTWVKRFEVQERLRDLREDQLIEGATAIYNHAFNPSGAPTTQTTTELEYINDQNVNKHIRSKLDGYNMLLELLKTDVTTEFLNKFQKLFKQFVMPENQWIYVTPLPDEDEGD